MSWRHINIQIPEAQKTPIRFNPKKFPSRNLIIKLSKVKYKETIPKAATEKHKTHIRGSLFDYLQIFQQKTCKSGEWDNIYKIL